MCPTPPPARPGAAAPVREPFWSFVSWNVPFSLRMSGVDPEAVLGCLPPGTRLVDGVTTAGGLGSLFDVRPRGSGGETYCISLDGDFRADAPDVAGALAVVEGMIRLHVAARAPEVVFVHAGVVGWRGGAMLLPGASGAGKSTLVAALIAQGATYYSDECAVLDESGRVHPFPKPLSLRGDGGGRKRGVPPRQLGAVVGESPLPPRWLMHVRYVPGSPWQCVPLSPGECALVLLENAVAARADAARVLRAACRAASTVRGWRCSRAEADDAAGGLLRLADETATKGVA